MQGHEDRHIRVRQQGGKVQRMYVDQIRPAAPNRQVQRSSHLGFGLAQTARIVHGGVALNGNEIARYRRSGHRDHRGGMPRRHQRPVKVKQHLFGAAHAVAVHGCQWIGDADDLQ